MDRSEIRDLMEKRAAAYNEGQALIDEIRARTGDAAGVWSAEDDAKWARIDADVANWTKTIERGETDLRVDSRFKELDEERTSRTGVSKDEYDTLFRRWMADGMAELSGEERKQMRAGDVSGKELRALGVALGAGGGYTVPEGFWNKITETQLAYSAVQEVANVITTETGADLPWMTNDDTANEGAILAENTAITEQDVEFGTKSLGAYLYTSKLVRVSYQLLQDSAVDIESFLGRKFGQRLGRIHNRHFTVGTGVAQPEGIVTAATTGKTTAGATAITYNEIVDLVHSVDPAYRGVNSKFMFNDLILAYLRKVRDDSGGAGLGRPIWEPSVQVGVPSTIFGYPYVINQNMASTVATTNTTALFGDFNAGYVVRRVRGTSLVRLDERYAEYLQVGFFAFDRMDGTADDTAAYKALVQA